MAKIIYALFEKPDDVEIALNNLDEAEIDITHSSVLMQNMQQAQQIIKNNGPLQNITVADLESKFKEKGFTQSDAIVYKETVEKGGAVLAMVLDNTTQDVVKEILQDQKAIQIHVQ